MGERDGKWSVRIGSEELWPLDWAEVVARVRSAKAEESAKIRPAGGVEWKPYSTSRASEPPVIEAPPLGDRLLNQRVTGGGASQLIADIRSLEFSEVFPLSAWLSDKPWNLVWVRWFAFFAFYPLMLQRLFAEGITLTGAAWALGLYFAVMWGLILFILLRPPKLETGTTLGIMGFTAFIGVSLLLTCQQLPVIRNFYNATESANLVGRAFGFVFGVGVLEEATKALPLWWCFIHKRKPTTPRESAFLGCMSGLAFGVAEAVSYSVMYAWGQETGQMGYGDYLAIEFLRLITLPLLHALWAGILGYFIGLAATLPRKQDALLIVGWVCVATLHGLYDTFSSGWIGTGIGLFSLAVFVGYTRSAEQILGRLQAQTEQVPSPG